MKMAASAAIFISCYLCLGNFKNTLNLPPQTHDVMFISNSISMIRIRA